MISDKAGDLLDDSEERSSGFVDAELLSALDHCLEKFAPKKFENSGLVFRLVNPSAALPFVNNFGNPKNVSI